jgi:ribosomal protein S18 acetylase RimI-like enzyme
MIIYERLTSIESAEDLEQIRKLYLANGWIEAGDGDIDVLIKKIVSHTYCFAIARDDGKLIGMGRSISDSVSDAYIQDVTVLPEYRQQGIGGKIIQFLIAYMQANGINWIGLISVPGQESFYEGQGFQQMVKFTPFKYEGKH